jgi:hypothetical protein
MLGMFLHAVAAPTQPPASGYKAYEAMDLSSCTDIQPQNLMVNRSGCLESA